MNTGFFEARSRMMPTYASLAMSAAVSRDVLVTPGSVYVSAQSDRLKFALSPNADGSEWHGFYSVRCRSSFPLQFVVDWKLPLDVKRKLIPPQPRQVRLR